MSLDGLRAWIGMVERKLTMRTRVFLALAAIAVGGAGAAVYLAVEAQEDSVSKADVQAVRDELAGRIGTGGGETDLTQLEAELRALRAEVAELRAEGTASKGGASKGTSDESTGGTEDTGGVGNGDAHPESSSKAKEEHGK